MVDLAALERPNQQPLDCLRCETRRIRDTEEPLFKDKSFLSPVTDESMAWNQPEGLEDFVVIQPPAPQRDPFVQYISRKFYGILRCLDWMYHKMANSEKEFEEWSKTTVFYKWKILIGAVTSFLVAIVGALFPVVSILILYFIKRTVIRIYALMGLTIAFALAVKLLTNGKTADVFSITAA